MISSHIRLNNKLISVFTLIAIFGVVPHSANNTIEASQVPLPGSVLKINSVDVNLGTFYKKAWQLIYLSTDSGDKPIENIVTIIIPTGLDLPSAEQLVSFQDINNGLSIQCAPSRTLLKKSILKQMDALHRFNIHMILNFLQKNWIVVVPDHQGPKSAFMAAILGAHLVLDGIRATINFLKLSDNIKIGKISNLILQ